MATTTTTTTKFLNTKKYNVVRAVMRLMQQEVVDTEKLQDKKYLKTQEFQDALSQAYGEVVASEMKFTSPTILGLVQGVSALQGTESVDQELVKSMDKEYLMGDYSCLLKTQMEETKKQEAEAREQARLAREEKKKLKAKRKKLSKKIPKDHFMTYSLTEIKTYLNEKRVVFPKTAKKVELYDYLTGKTVFEPKTHKTLPVQRTDEETEEKVEETEEVEEEVEEEEPHLEDDEDDQEEEDEEKTIEETLETVKAIKKVRDLKAYLKENYELEYKGTRKSIMEKFEKYLREEH